MARTPSVQAHASVLAAALELFCERGIDTTSMDAIAEKSGVSKATIYKHWTDKEALCLDVLSNVHEVDCRPEFDSGDIRTDLEAVLSYRPSVKVSEQQNRMLPHLMAYAARNVRRDLARARDGAADPADHKFIEARREARTLDRSRSHRGGRAVAGSDDLTQNISQCGKRSARELGKACRRCVLESTRYPTG